MKTEDFDEKNLFIVVLRRILLPQYSWKGWLAQAIFFGLFLSWWLIQFKGVPGRSDQIDWHYGVSIVFGSYVLFCIRMLLICLFKILDYVKANSANP